jgi:hypothetical protein
VLVHISLNRFEAGCATPFDLSRLTHEFHGGTKSGKKMGLSFVKLLKKHVEKMSDFRLSMIFMKTNELNPSFHDVNEKKGS